MAPSSDLSLILPRVVIVSRRCVRKNKFVDFVGEYHLDLLVSYGAVPVIVPRVAGVHMLLDSFEPIHGVLLCEGEDIDPSLYDDEGLSALTPQELDEIRRLHVSDTAVDREKDSIELRLAALCRARGIPYLGICRGSQVLNVAAGGSLYLDVEKEMSRRSGPSVAVRHIDYENYDGHRHRVRVVEGSPLGEWFSESLDEGMGMEVNSYHHQGVKRLVEGFVPMAYSEDGLIEGFYDPEMYDPAEGRFCMGLQFHPERMRRPESDEFDYPGCPRAYQEFVKAVIAYQKKVNSSANIKTDPGLNQEMEQKRKILVRSFSLAKNLYSTKHHAPQSEEPVLEVGAQFLQSNAALSLQQEKRLKQMGATVRNASSYLQKLRMNEEKEGVVRGVMEKMSPEHLSELLSFYHMMGKICSEVLEKKLCSMTTLDE